MSIFRNIRKKPKLDMNPMTDMAFLLVTFFMMTTTFKADLPEEILIPPSQAELKLPENDICTISITEDGKVFFGVDNKYNRTRLLGNIAGRNEITLNNDQAMAFSLQSNFGVPINELPEYLDAEVKGKYYEQKGIPIGREGELDDWIMAARIVNPKLRFAIQADGKVKFPVIHTVFETLRELNITRFNLVTDKKIDVSES